MSNSDDLPTTATPPATVASYAERRAAMADETRTRILDACVAILARGVAELSIPAVAREAGVSVPTVYRNFPDKRTLVHETAVHLKRLRGRISAPTHLDDLPAHLRATFTDAASLAESVRAALVSEPILAAKRELGEYEQRRNSTEKMLGPVLAGVPAAEREHAVLMTMVLCSSSTLRGFREIAGVGPDIAADTVAWTIGRILGRTFSRGPDAAPAKPAAPRSKPATPRRRTKQQGARR